MFSALLAKFALVAMLSDPAVCGKSCVPADYLMTCLERSAPDSTPGELVTGCSEDYEQMQREANR